MQPQTLPLIIEPGLYSESSGRTAVNRWRAGNRVRFHNGFPEKLGGWVQEPLTLPSYSFGIPRTVRDWNRLDGSNVIAIGTHEGVYVWVEDTLYDITPVIQATPYFGGTDSPLIDPFTTDLDAFIVGVTHVNHGLGENSLIEFANASVVAGQDLNGVHRAIIASPNSYVVKLTTRGTANTVGGGTVDYKSRLSPGAPNTSPGVGYGTGPYGEEEYGTPRTGGVGGTSPTTNLRARIWSLQNWGEDLIVCPRGGGVYLWDASVSPVAASFRITAAPYEALGVVMSPRDRHLIAYGCTPEAAGPTDPLDPLVIRWCTQNNYNEWTSAATTTAGELRIEQGTEILQGYLAGNNILFHTETASYRMFATQTARTFGLLGIGEAGGVSPQGGIAFRERAYWIGVENFFTFQGSIAEIPCDVHQTVFEDINQEQRDLIIAGVNRRFSEVCWFYPSKNSLEIDRYVFYDTVGKTWTVGELDRSAWFGNSVRFQQPYGLTPEGILYVHEIGTTANGAPMNEWLDSYELMLPSTPGIQGRPVMRVNSVAQDFSRLDSSVLVTLRFRKWPQSIARTKNPVQVSHDPTKNQSGEIRRRGRGRYLGIRIEGGNFLGDWRLGSLDVNLQPDGK